MSLKRIEWPTIGLAFVIYGGWAALTWWHAAFPVWFVLPALAAVIAWQGSLQHEVIHGHPTRSRGVNDAIGSIPLAMWLPYAIYRRSHLQHHRTEHVTDPAHDPESRYLPSQDAGLLAAIERLNRPLAGRLLIGPALLILRLAGEEAHRLRNEPRAVLRDWVPHLIGVVAVIVWLRTCGFPLTVYALGCIYPAIAITLIRSFAEHRADPVPAHRVAIVESRGPFALLFLNNNLHAAHHTAPMLPWYRLPAFYHRERGALLAANGGLLYRGYGEIMRLHLFRPHDVLIHPDHRQDAHR